MRGHLLLAAASLASMGIALGCDHDRYDRDETHVRAVTVVPGDAGRFPSGSPSVPVVTPSGVPATPPVAGDPVPATVVQPPPTVIVTPPARNVEISPNNDVRVVPSAPVIVAPPRESVPGSRDNTGAGTVPPNGTGVPGSGTGIGSGGGTGTGASTPGGPDIGGRDRPTDGIVHQQQ